jgi:hypothetical protein
VRDVFTGCVNGVLACYLALTGWEAASTPVTDGDITLFAAPLSCGAGPRPGMPRQLV